MHARRERIWLFGTALVLALCAVLTVHQFVENESHHAEVREAFILAHNKGDNVDAERLYDRLKYDMPEEPTRHLIDDLERTTVITPTNQSASSNLLVRYHLSVQHEVQRRVEKYLKPPKANSGL